MIIQPKIRGFICTTAHPEGCLEHVRGQIAHVRSSGGTKGGAGKVLVVGASTGYGLSSRIAAAFGSGAATLGLYYEKPGTEKKPGSAGWYNSLAFRREAEAAGLYAGDINGDAFSDGIKARAVETIRRDLGEVDLVVYSLASPKRTNPRTGVTHKSCLKPIGGAYVSKTLDTDKGEVGEIVIEPADESEVADTVSVMGGEDWRWWIDALEEGGVLADGAKTVAYSYIGPELTYPIYRNGTIGRAKADLEAAARSLDARLKQKGGAAYVSVNKALVTQASSAIPVVPLYISLLYKVMKEKGLHEGCIEQMQRLFSERLYGPEGTAVDAEGRIRVDDWEMRAEVQDEVAALWPVVTTDNLRDVSDFDGYRADFLKLFGFGFDGVDYGADTDPLTVGLP